MTTQHKIFLSETNQWITVSDDVYKAFYRPVWRTQKHAQKRAECVCSRKKLWQCEGDCHLCSHHLSDSARSLDAPITNADGEEYTLVDTLVDESAITEEMIADKVLLEQLFKRLSELFPEARRIGELRMKGIPDRDIADIIGMPRSTFRSKLAKLKTLLQEEYPDFF